MYAKPDPSETRYNELDYSDSGKYNTEYIRDMNKWITQFKKELGPEPKKNDLKYKGNFTNREFNVDRSKWQDEKIKVAVEENRIPVLESEKETLETELKKYTRIDKPSFGWGWLSKDLDYYYYNNGKFELLGKYDGYINDTKVFTSSRNYVLDMGEKTTTVSITKHKFKKGNTDINLLELEESTKKDYEPNKFSRSITNWRMEKKQLEEKSNLYTKNQSSGGSKKRKQIKTGRKRKSKRTKTHKKFV